MLTTVVVGSLPIELNYGDSSLSLRNGCKECPHLARINPPPPPKTSIRLARDLGKAQARDLGKAQARDLGKAQTGAIPAAGSQDIGLPTSPMKTETATVVVRLGIPVQSAGLQAKPRGQPGGLIEDLGSPLGDK